MRVDVITIFPLYFAPLDVSLLGKAQVRGLVDIRIHDLRAHTDDAHRTVDDAPFGGGPGMVMKPEPWWAALTAVTAGGAGGAAGADGAGGAGEVGDQPSLGSCPRIIFPTPSGTPFTQSLAASLAAEPWLIFACGRYEGIDGRVAEHWATDEISLGDYVLGGGEVATLVMLEAVTRLLPGVVGNQESVADDSFQDGLLEGPAYTRPATFEGYDVPPVLLSGDHAAIARWRRDVALRRTASRRPELLEGQTLSAHDQRAIEEHPDPNGPSR